jgi:hypothetical protein
LACPYFMPTHALEGGAWIHPSRLPLGGGWQGHCTAPGHEGAVPALEEMHEGCNLGYASRCPRLPENRDRDAVRFGISRESDTHLFVAYVCERQHLPVEHGFLEFRIHDSQCLQPHPDARIQKMAECFVESRLRRSRATHGGNGSDLS